MTLNHGVYMKTFIFVFTFVSLTIGYIYAQEISVVTEDWPPYNYKQQEEIIGFGTEVVQETLKRAHIKYSITLYPWARAYHNALYEKNVLIYTMARNDEREWLFKWIGPFAPRHIDLFKRKGKTDIVVNSLEDAKKYMIGVVRDDATHLFLTNHGFNNIHIVVREDQNIKMLFKDRIKLITGNEMALAYKLKQLGYRFDQLEKVLTLIDEGGYYMGISKGTPGNITIQLRKAFHQIENDGTLEQIRRKYLFAQ
jgi:polar amino acid transport system substrate-binding protein